MTDPLPPMEPVPVETIPQDVGNRKAYAGILAILLGFFGVHKFLLGYAQAGTIMLLVTLLTCGLGAMVMWVIGVVEGITYLSKSDADFYGTYIQGRKPWF